MILILTGKTREYDMKRIAFYLGLAAALMASCSIQEEDIKTPQQGDVIYYASFEQPAEDGTRVYANEDLLLRWTADDKVSIFGKNTYNQQYKFLGETGDNSGGFGKVDVAEYVTGNPISHTVSVYPYQASTKITEDEVVTLTLPAEQHYAENTFGLGANTMVSVSSDNVLQYKSIGGFLMLKLYGDDVSVLSITLKGNNGEKLAGKASVTMPVDGVPQLTMESDATEKITLIFDTPVELGHTAEESTQFWFVVPPVTFNHGFTIEVNRTKRGVFEKSTSKSVSINRNQLSRMAPIEVETPQPDNVIYYTSSEGTTVIPNPGADFGATILSNEYVDGRGIITFDGDVTSIGDHAFYGCASLTGISIPDAVTTIGDSAFQGCSSLTSLVFPKNVSNIGRFAFRGCYTLAFYSFLNPVPPTITNDSFTIEYSGSPQPPSYFDYRILVPETALAVYQREWDDYALRIYAMPTKLASSLQPPTAQDLTIRLSEHIVYTYSLLNLIELRDTFHRELLNNGRWMIGDGDNGIPDNVSAWEFYGISMTFSYDIIPEIRRLMSFEYLPDGDLLFSFNYSSEIQFMGYVVIPTTITFSSILGLSSCVFNIRILGEDM